MSSQLSRSFTVQNYTLKARVAEINFEQSVEIFTVKKRYSVLIQTDKPLYKPGDNIKFRVLLIDFEMKPYRVDKMKVEFFDPLNNVVAQIEEEEYAKLEKGVYVNSFGIAMDPIMGKWGIRVVSSVNEDSKNKTKEDLVTLQHFEVKDYVKSQFEVIVDTKHHATKDEGYVRLDISAKYTHGGFVKGKAVITARVYDIQFPNIVQHAAAKSVDVEFKKLVNFDIKNDLKIINEIRPYEVKFNVDFEEKRTGLENKGAVSVRIYRSDEYNLQIVRKEKRFKPGFPYEFKVIVYQSDGSLSNELFTPVKLKINYFYKAPKCTLLSEVGSFVRGEFLRYTPLRNGMAQFKMDVPANTTAMSLKVKFLDAEASVNVSRYESKSREYLVIKSLTKR